jgi:hypothetical protein
LINRMMPFYEEQGIPLQSVPRHSGSDTRRQSQALLPARLLARPQSDRAGLRQNEDPASQGRCPDDRTDLANHCALLDCFTPTECANYFRNAGYASA